MLTSLRSQMDSISCVAIWPNIMVMSKSCSDFHRMHMLTLYLVAFAINIHLLMSKMHQNG